MCISFEKCSSLKTVYYSGLELEWNDIYIESNNSPIVNAKKVFEYKIVISGDANDDGVINAVDLAQLRLSLLSGEDAESACDANGDGEINIKDLVRLKKFISGVDVKLGV